MEKDILVTLYQSYEAFNNGLDSLTAAKKEKLQAYLTELDDTQCNKTLSVFVKDYFFSEEAIANDLGLEETINFVEWLSNELGVLL